MRLSIVIPAYNEQAYLLACLEGVMSEVRRCRCPEEVEVLVVDNASEDMTADVVSGIPGVQLVHEPQKGLTHARQRGLEASNGALIGYIDADTKMPAGWIDRVLRAFECNPDVVCVSGPYVYYDATRWQWTLVWLYWLLLASPAYWLTRYMVVGGNFAARRSALMQIGGFDTTIAFYGEDTNIARRLAAMGKVRFLLRLSMRTSARRLHAEGLIATSGKYVANFLSEVVLKRPLSQTYRDVR